MEGSVSILWNGTRQNHERLIRKLFKDAKRFDCVVAFAKWSGFEPLQQLLVERLKDGMAARFIIGLDFCQSEPKVLERLLALKSKYGIDVFVSASADSSTFHPKVYRFEHGDGVSLLIGSANLTRGGLSNNHEVSAILRHKSDGRALSYMNALVKDQDVNELTPAILTSYRKRYGAYNLLRSRAENRIKRSLEAKKPGVSVLREILREMNEGSTKPEFVRQVRARERSRKQARDILAKIDKAPRLSKNAFLRLYGRLTSGLWHSGGLHRSKTKIAGQPEVFRQIVSAAAEHHTGSIAEVFEDLRELAKQAHGIGPNVLTEILQTYDNDRYAVMNQNSVAGMRLAGFSDFPEKPSKGSVDGPLYEHFCKRADAIRRKLGLGNLSELDAVFNYAYWGEEEGGEE